jgi:hypothetical protein
MNKICADDGDVAAELQLSVPLDVVRRQRFKDALIEPLLNALNEMVTNSLAVRYPLTEVTVCVGLTDDDIVRVAKSKSETAAEMGIEFVFDVSPPPSVDVSEGVVQLKTTRSENWRTVHLTGTLFDSLHALRILAIWLFAGPLPEATWKGHVLDADGVVSSFRSKHGENAVERLWGFLHKYSCTIDTPGIPPRSEIDLKRVVWHAGKNSDYTPVMTDYLVQAYRESLKATENDANNVESLAIVGRGPDNVADTQTPTVSVNAQMLDIMQSVGNEVCLGWSVEDWREKLGERFGRKPAKSTIHKQKTWDLIRKLRIQTGAETLEHQTTRDQTGKRRSRET